MCPAGVPVCPPVCPAGVPVCPAGVPVCPAGVPVCPAGVPVCPAGVPVCPAGVSVCPAVYALREDPLETVRPERNRICSLIGVPQPVLKVSTTNSHACCNCSTACTWSHLGCSHVQSTCMWC